MSRNPVVVFHVLVSERGIFHNITMESHIRCMGFGSGSHRQCEGVGPVRSICHVISVFSWGCGMKIVDQVLMLWRKKSRIVNFVKGFGTRIAGKVIFTAVTFGQKVIFCLWWVIASVSYFSVCIIQTQRTEEAGRWKSGSLFYQSTWKVGNL